MEGFKATRGDQAGMDPEGLMPADPALHEQDETARQDAARSTAGSSDAAQGAADALTSPHDQPVEGGVEEAQDGDGTDR